jgi:hypothetical protein
MRACGYWVAAACVRLQDDPYTTIMHQTFDSDFLHVPDEQAWSLIERY